MLRINHECDSKVRLGFLDVALSAQTNSFSLLKDRGKISLSGPLILINAANKQQLCVSLCGLSLGYELRIFLHMRFKPKINKTNSFVTLYLAQMDFCRYLFAMCCRKLSIYSQHCTYLNYLRIDLSLYTICIWQKRVIVFAEYCFRDVAESSRFCILIVTYNDSWLIVMWLWFDFLYKSILWQITKRIYSNMDGFYLLPIKSWNSICRVVVPWIHASSSAM